MDAGDIPQAIEIPPAQEAPQVIENLEFQEVPQQSVEQELKSNVIE